VCRLLTAWDESNLAGAGAWRAFERKCTSCEYTVSQANKHCADGSAKVDAQGVAITTDAGCADACNKDTDCVEYAINTAAGQEGCQLYDSSCNTMAADNWFMKVATCA